MGRPTKPLDTLPGPTLFRTVRLLGRAPSPPDQRRFSGILVVQAIRGCMEAGAKGEITIRAVADRMHIAPSTASRLVSDAVAAGYVETTPSGADRRSMTVRLTASGGRLLRNAVAYQSKVYEQATRGWPEADKQTFDRLLVAFCNQLIDES